MDPIDEATLRALAEMADEHLASAPSTPADHITLGGALPDAKHRALLDAVLATEARFERRDTEGRRAAVLLGGLGELEPLAALLRDLTIPLARRFGLDPARLEPPAGGELVVSVHRHGEFFGAHPDVRDPRQEPGERALTCVYHLHRLPRPFEGGELRLYDHVVVGGRPVPVAAHLDVPVEDNSLVAYLPTTRHEVLTVRSPEDRSFAAGRFAVIGHATWR